MQQPFGHSVNVSISLSRTWLSLGPGWAALAGALSTGQAGFEFPLLLQLAGLWLLADPVLGTLWELTVGQGLWRRFVQAQLPPPPSRGFYLPYAQPGSAAGRVVLRYRQVQVWWRESFWPQYADGVTAFGLSLGLALLIGVFLSPIIFALTLLAIVLTLFAGQTSPDLTATGGGRHQSVVQFLLPWLMGSLLWPVPVLPGLGLGLCFWAIYLGGLRMQGDHASAKTLFFLGQTGAIGLLLALRLLPGAVLLSVLLVAQWLILLKFNEPAQFLAKAQAYLVVGIIVTGVALGSL
ncbi:MAG TPA: hypothetical protein VGD99_01775 [Anaerolineae bacterium]